MSLFTMYVDYGINLRDKRLQQNLSHFFEKKTLFLEFELEG